MEALSVGLEPAIVDVVRHNRPLTGLGAKEAAIVQVARELGLHKVTSDTYARAVKLLGKTNLVDVIDLMAQYTATAVNLTAANQWMPPQMKQFLPLPFTMPDDILPDSRSRIPVVNPDRRSNAATSRCPRPPVSTGARLRHPRRDRDRWRVSPRVSSRSNPARDER